MSFFGAFWLAKTGEDYTTDNAVWFDGSADYMIWTPPKAGNRQTFTYSFWMKRSEISHDEYVLTAGDSNTTYGWYYAATDLAYVNFNTSTANNFISNGKFRDPTAWQHIFVSFNTASGVKKVFINGLEPSAGTNNEPTAGEEHNMNNTVEHRIGSTSGEPSSTYNGYLAEFILLDGVYHATPVDIFGEFDSDGIWSPKDPEDLSDWGGVNSVWLKFDDSTYLGKNSRPTAVTANPGTYKIDNSLWLDGSADYLSKTFSGAGDDADKGIFSCWLKLNDVDGGVAMGVFSGGSSPGDSVHVSTALKVDFQRASGGLDIASPGVHRDPSAWFHLLVSMDTNQAASADRFHLYINGVRELWTGTVISQNTAMGWFQNVSHAIGRENHGSGSSYGNYYIAEAIGIDGRSIQNGNNSITDFGGYDANGNWVPADPSGLTFGTNGFHLDFALAQGSGNGPGNDVSGNNNDWTNNSLTAAQTSTDTPTNTSGDNEGNYPVWNIGNSSLDHATSVIDSVTEGNLRATVSSNNTSTIVSTMTSPASGKYMMRFVNKDASNNSNILVGLWANGQDLPAYNASAGIASSGNVGVVYRFSGGALYINGTNSHTYTTAASADNTLDLAWDAETGKVWIAVNGTWQDGEGNTGGGSTDISGAGTGNVATLTSGYQYVIACSMWDTTSVFIDQDGGTLPTDFKRFNTANFSDPTVTDPRKWFAPVLYTGSGNTRDVRGCYDSTGTIWTPDLAWLKCRSNDGTNHKLYDTPRGAGKEISLNNTGDQSTYTAGMSAFVEGGITVGSGTTGYNESAYTFVLWCLKAGGAPTADNTGDRTPTNNSVMKNDAAVTTSNFFASADIYPTRMSIANHGGFAIGTYTGTASDPQTVAHGLGSIPEMMVVRHLDTDGQDWVVYHKDCHAGSDDPEDYNLAFNTNADRDDNATKWNDTAPTSTLFTVGSSSGVNGDGKKFVFYLFKRISGLIGIGTYVGNGNADGACAIIDDGGAGFRPAWLLIKNITQDEDWYIYDGARSPYNATASILNTNANTAERTSADNQVHFLANGFKFYDTGSINAGTNNDGDSYVYLAFADQPFNAQSRAK